MSALSEAREVYRQSRKQRDVFWNVWIARPLAAVLLLGLRRTPLTPNQVTFLGLFLFFVATALLALVGSWAGFLAAIGVLQLSYLLDCADGQLARLKGMTSKVGAYLDFFVDEVKALLLVAAMAVRLWRQEADVTWLFVGLGGVTLVSVATSLTTFVRRPEYAGIEKSPGEPVVDSRPSGGGPAKLVAWAVMRTLRWIVHYPSWTVYLALADGHDAIDGAVVFLFVYLGAYALYVGRTGLGVLVRLGTPAFYRAGPAEPAEPTPPPQTSQESPG